MLNFLAISTIHTPTLSGQPHQSAHVVYQIHHANLHAGPSLSDESATGAEQLNHTSMELTELANQLQEDISHFKTG